jgi:hypothetical protein
MTHERRNRRSEKAHEAMTLFLESLREKSGLTAVALTTRDGLLVAGAGRTVDVEWMGALGAASRLAKFAWDELTLHVQRLAVNDVEMFLTCAGQPVNGASVAAGLTRILAA